MPHYTTTPWRHPSDLLALRSHLYPHPPSTTPSTPSQHHHQMTAITRIHTYKLRSPNLPHAVESTALLLDSLHHHHNTTNSPHSIRAVYASAFTRFVTGFADIGRAKSGRLAGPENQRSMLEVARGIGMPEEFVALRHEVTHEELPSVGRLRKAVLAGLEWLWEVYWSRLPEGVGMEVDEGVGEGVAEEIRKVLKEYRGARREGFKGRKKQAEGDLVGFYDQIDALLAPSAARLELLAAVLVDEKLLFPSNRVIGASMEGAFKIWDELLTAIDQSVSQLRSESLTPLLAKHLLEALPSQTTESDVHAENIYLWLLHLIDDHANPELRAEVMRYCCLYASYWTGRLGETLLSSGDESFKDDWEDLFAASRIADGEPEQGVQDEAADDDEEMSDVDAAAAKLNRELNSTSSHGAGYTGGGWRLAAIPPRVPIGVVS
ncbi:Pre-rRNA-processing protein las1 [Teratosphaeria destructans]|uniref:Pre-rRNA-processing protein las1 n=1 Tax=Teratosphaeria destructans TaxID=418781 RepID=A0A9W7SUM9_9PEZI|nr:Pre-rRNA-processing protein las1 [Teratosphaeria destructans]